MYLLYYLCLRLWILLLLLSTRVRSIRVDNNNNHLDFSSNTRIDLALEQYYLGDIAQSLTILQTVLFAQPNDVEANQILGSIYTKINKPLEGSKYLFRAVELSKWEDTRFIANYIESLRLSNDLEFAWTSCIKGVSMHPNSTHILYNSGLVAQELNDYANAYELFARAVKVDPLYKQAWIEGGELMLFYKKYTEVESFLIEANKHISDNVKLISMLASSKYHLDKVEEAIYLYKVCLSIEPTNKVISSITGSLLQLLERSEEALIHYKNAMPFNSLDAGIRSNYGALLSNLGRNDEGYFWLKESLKIDPNMIHTLINLGNHYQDEGLLFTSKLYLNRAAVVSINPSLIVLRTMLMLSPVATSWVQMIEERTSMEYSLLKMLSANDTHKVHLDSTFYTIHFYIVYHGNNDRHMQELIVMGYENTLHNFIYILPMIKERNSLSVLQEELLSIQQKQQLLSYHTLFNTSEEKEKRDRNNLIPIITEKDTKTEIVTRKIKVAFISRYFDIFEPHGMLLAGIMKNLPRSQFRVIVLDLSKNKLKPLSPSIIEACDEIIQGRLTRQGIQEQLTILDLDILVFADTLSEPFTHFLAHSRLAKVQCAFWGNPITSGSTSIDYFVSGEILEHPFRTHIPLAQEPYTEQVVLLEGQGIWYDIPRPEITELKKAGISIDHLAPTVLYDKLYFGLQDVEFIYFCPQSVFKMHPLFDYVFRDILLANPEGHIVVTAGRKPVWTDTYMTRLQSVLGYSLMLRLHLIERVSSEKFLSLLRIADVMLHPFPFDGSRTSADGLIAGIPVLTMPTEYLRGRMGAAFYRTMNMPELVARNRSEYIKISIKLHKDKTFYKNTIEKIKENLFLVWEDMEYAYSWFRLLTTAVGVTPLQWNEYMIENNRNLTYESITRDIRGKNMQLFDSFWGNEGWLLEGNVAYLEPRYERGDVPKVFNDWKSTVKSTDR